MKNIRMKKEKKKLKFIEINNVLQDYMKQNDIDSLKSDDILEILKANQIVNNYQTMFQYFRRRMIFGMEYIGSRIVVNRIKDYERIYSIQEVAKKLKTTKAKVYSIIVKKEIPTIKIADSKVVTRKIIERIKTELENSEKQRVMKDENKNKEIPKWKTL